MIDKRKKRILGFYIANTIGFFTAKIQRGILFTASDFKKRLETQMNKNLEGNVLITLTDGNFKIKITFADYFCIIQIFKDENYTITWYRR